MSQFTDALVSVCRREFARWDNGVGRETAGIGDTLPNGSRATKDYYLMVGDYWRSIGLNGRTGRTIVNGDRPAWSSAFISYCVKEAATASGAIVDFGYYEAHWYYIRRAFQKTSGTDVSHVYAARKFENYKPKVGDIVVAERRGGGVDARDYTYDIARTKTSWYPSHGDIVISVSTSRITTIGGNIIDNVDDKMPRLTQNGFLRPRVDGGVDRPWIAVLECLV